MNFKILITVFGLCGMICYAAAQEKYALKTYTTIDGLPHNQVLSIAQDSTGFVWIATWDGLSRFDGYEFKNYYHNPLDSTTIPNFSTTKVAVDKNNNLFVASIVSSPVLYDPAKEQFYQTTQGENFKTPDLTVNSHGDVYCIMNNAKPGKWDNKSKIFQPLQITDINGREYQIPYIANNFLVFDNLEHLWIIFSDKEEYIAYISDVIDNKAFVRNVLRFKNPYLNYIRRGSQPHVWFKPFIIPPADTLLVTPIGVFSVSSLSPELVHGQPGFPFSGEIPDKIPFIWPIGKYKIGKLMAGSTKADTIDGLSEPFITDVIADRQGNLWMGVQSDNWQGKGLTQAIPIQPFFKHYLLEEDTKSEINAFFAVHKDKFGYVWAAARNRNFIYRISPGGSEKKLNMLDDRTLNLAFHPRSFLEDSAGLWIGYYYNLLMYYDFSNKKFSRKYCLNSTNNIKSRKEGFRDLKRTDLGIISALDSLVYLFDPVKGTMIPQFNFPIVHNHGFAVNKLVYTPKGFFVGLNYGIIWQIDSTFQKSRKLQFLNVTYNVEDICVGDHDDIWIALLGGGLGHMELNTAKKEIFTTADGLSNNTCYSILKDKKGNLWISTNQGISRFNPETRQFRNFDVSDGLRIIEFNSDAAYLAPDGEMFFGGMGGVVSFYPEQLEENEPSGKQAPLVITDFIVSGETRRFPKAVYDMDTVRLEKGDNNFKVTFACLDFRNADKIRYRYRIAGLDTSWTETGAKQRFVNYASLSPGNYPLEIQATNRNGEWASPSKLVVTIPPRYYQTLWFKISVLSVLLVLISGLIVGYNKRLRLKAGRELDQLKLEGLRGQMNPHFIFNSLNSINYFISQNDRLSANRYIADFSRLIRSILGNFSSDYIPISKELESLQDYLKLEHLRFSDKFDYSVQVPEGLVSSEIMVFPGMVQPFVENAIWHGVRGLEGRAGHIRINFLWTGTSLTCSVEDDGIGRKLAEERKNDLPGKTSRGIGIVLERLRIINNLKKTNYQIVIKDLYPEKVEPGTLVIIDIPVK